MDGRLKSILKSSHWCGLLCRSGSDSSIDVRFESIAGLGDISTA